MLSKDLKRLGLFISGLLTTCFESLINLLPNLGARQILNPICILIAVLISTYFIHGIKKYCNNLLIKNNEDRILEISDSVEIEKLKTESFKLKKENSKIDLLF